MKKWIKKILKIVFKIALAITLFFGSYLLCAYFLQFITTNNDYVTPKNGTEVFIISNGVHADICFPLNEHNIFWLNCFDVNSFSTLKTKPKYISFGWGDKGFFLDTPTWEDLTFNTAFKALFIPSDAALHVSYLDYNPILSERTKSFKVNFKELLKMEKYILSTITFKQKSPILIDCCRYPNSHNNFYEANYKYHLFNTCNVWTNEVIKIGGVKTSIWTPFDKGMLVQF